MTYPLIWLNINHHLLFIGLWRTNGVRGDLGVNGVGSLQKAGKEGVGSKIPKVVGTGRVEKYSGTSRNGPPKMPRKKGRAYERL